MTKVLARNNARKNTKMHQLLENKRSIFWLMMSGFMALIFARNVFSINFPIIVLLGYFCIMALFSDRDEIIAMAVSCVPFTSAFQYRYALLCLIVIYLLKFPRSVKYYIAFIPLVCMMIWEMFHGIEYSFSFSTFLKQFSELIFCTFVISLSNKKFDYKFITRVLAITVSFACTVLLIKVLQSFGFDFYAVFLSGNYRLGINDYDESSYVMNYNANMLGIMCNLGISAMLLRIHKSKANVFDVLLIISLAFFGFLTLSRTFVLTLSMIVVLFVFATGAGIVKSVKKFITLSFLIIIFSLVFYSVFPFVFDNLIERFNADDVTNGRSGLFAFYNEHIFSSFKHLVFGVGIQNMYSKIYNLYLEGPGNVPHNGFQEIIVGWGIIGFILFISFILVMFAVLEKKGQKISFINLIPLIVILVVAQAGQLITSGPKLVALVFAFVALCEDFHNDKTVSINTGGNLL